MSIRNSPSQSLSEEESYTYDTDDKSNKIIINNTKNEVIRQKNEKNEESIDSSKEEEEYEYEYEEDEEEEDKKNSDPKKSETKLQISSVSNQSSGLQDNEPKQEDSPKTREQKIREELEKSYNGLVERGEQPPVNYSIPIQRLLQRRYIIAMRKQDYDEGAKIDIALKKNNKYIEEQVEKDRVDTLNETFNQRLNAIEDELAEKNKFWDKQVELFKDEYKNASDQLEQRHQAEEEEFAAIWGNPENLICFNKPSQTLLNIRAMQKNLALTKHFREAKMVKEQGDRLQQQETAEAEMRVLDAMLLAHNKLQERQKRERFCFEEKEKRIEFFISRERYNETHSLEAQATKLKRALNSEKPKNKKPYKTAFRSTSRTRSALSERASIPPKDRETLKAMNRFRTQDTPQKLNLVGLDVKSIMKRPASAIRVIQRRQ